MDTLKKQINSLVDNIVDDKIDIDSVQLFIDECLVPCPEQKELLGVVHRAYLSYCSHRGYIATPMCYFPGKLRTIGLDVTIGRGSKYYVRGHYLDNL